MKRKIIVSGIQPTKKLHLGHYLGVIKQWKDLQENPNYECKFGIMDLHARTTERNPDELLSISSKMQKSLVKIGIDKRFLFIQSHKQNEIFEMYWKLSCHTSIGQLNRMTQFKEKADKNNQNLGLFSYPVLMAADIVALEADLVPVGEDQKQHLELTRDLAKKLGLKVPEPIISKACGRIMSLTDTAKKMSKSDPNDNSRINLDDDADTIRNKIKKAVTTDEGRLNLERIFTGCGGSKDITFNWSSAAQAKQIIAEQIILELVKIK